MKSFLRATIFVFIFIFSYTNSSAQTWESYEAADYNVKFSIPAEWKTTTGSEGEVPFLESVSKDGEIYFFIFIYKDASISTEQLLDNAVKDLGIKLTGDAAQENLNGMDAWVASAVGMMDNIEVGMFITAATYDENNYVAYIFTPSEYSEKNSEVMNKIIDSIEPMKK